jgi:hypothetical protein
MTTLDLTPKELYAIIDAMAFIEAGGGVDGESTQDQMARDRVTRKVHAALVSERRRHVGRMLTIMVGRDEVVSRHPINGDVLFSCCPNGGPGCIKDT